MVYETTNLTHYSWFNCYKFSLKMNNISSTVVLFTLIPFKKMLKCMYFSARSLPTFYFKLLYNTRQSLAQLPPSLLKNFSILHGGKQLSKWFTAVPSCDDFLYCEPLVISAKRIFLWLWFIFYFKLCSYVPSGVNMMKPIKYHQLKHSLNHAYVCSVIN